MLRSVPVGRVIGEDAALNDLHEGAYGGASIAFILIVLIMVVGPFALMALGLHFGFRITW